MPHDPNKPASCAQIGRECGDLKAALNRVQEVEVKWQRTDDALGRYRGALVATAASLAAAISLLERGSKKAAPSDKMFDQMLSDYRKALADARDTLNCPDAGGIVGNPRSHPSR